MTIFQAVGIVSGECYSEWECCVVALLVGTGMRETAVYMHDMLEVTVTLEWQLHLQVANENV